MTDDLYAFEIPGANVSCAGHTGTCYYCHQAIVRNHVRKISSNNQEKMVDHSEISLGISWMV